MAENIFKDLLPEEERDFENQPKVNNEFNDLLPQENTLKMNLMIFFLKKKEIYL